MPSLTLTTLSNGRVLIIGVREKVARHQSSDTIDLCHVEPIVIHVSVHVDDLTRLKAELGLERITQLF